MANKANMVMPDMKRTFGDLLPTTIGDGVINCTVGTLSIAEFFSSTADTTGLSISIGGSVWVQQSIVTAGNKFLKHRIKRHVKVFDSIVKKMNGNKRVSIQLRTLGTLQKYDMKKYD